MGEAEKKWRAQYKINPQVRRVSETKDGIPMYVGFDEQLKPFEELTMEERDNYLARYKQEISMNFQSGKVQEGNEEIEK